MQKMEMRGDNVFYECPSCRQWFQFGPHRYDGKSLPSGIAICNACKPDSPMDRFVAASRNRSRGNT